MASQSLTHRHSSVRTGYICGVRLKFLALVRNTRETTCSGNFNRIYRLVLVVVVVSVTETVMVAFTHAASGYPVVVEAT